MSFAIILMANTVHVTLVVFFLVTHSITRATICDRTDSKGHKLKSSRNYLTNHTRSISSH